MWLSGIYGILLIFLSLQNVEGVFKNPGLPVDDVKKHGDLMIGAFEHLQYSDLGIPCSGKDRNNFVVQAVQSMDYLINKINMESVILPNISLGYVVVNECFHPTVAQYQLTKLLPVDDCAVKCLVGEEADHDGPPNPEAHLSHHGSYSIVAFIAPISSGMSKAISGLASRYEIPHISYGATHQDLSDKISYPYFSRIVPPDQFQARAIIDILRHFNWSYISTVGSNSDYSRNGMGHIQRLARLHGICIAYSAEARSEFEDEDYDRIVRNLQRKDKAKVVITFLEDLKFLLYAVERAKAAGQFIFIASDGPELFTKDRHPKILGINSLKLFFSGTGKHRNEDFEEYYRGLSPWVDPHKNPWLGEITPETVQCSWSVPESDIASCLKYKTLADYHKTTISDYYTKMLDSVSVIANALGNLVKDNCPEASSKKHLLTACVTGARLLAYIRNISFTGYTGKVGFDSNGDGLSGYDIAQWQHISTNVFGYKKVGSWDRQTSTLSLDGRLQWSGIAQGNGKVRVSAMESPESVCAKPCMPGEHYIQGELKCCWECRPCRENERVREDVQGCVLCPLLTWPDQVNFTTCESIPATFLRWLDPISLGLLALASVGALSTLLIALIFTKKRSKKVIKGSSLELMIIILAALFGGFVCVFLLIVEPQDMVCHFSYYFFHISCSLIFLPLLFKTNRLYRIFRAAEKCQQATRFITTGALILLCVGFLVIVVSAIIPLNIPIKHIGL